MTLNEWWQAKSLFQSLEEAGQYFPAHGSRCIQRRNDDALKKKKKKTKHTKIDSLQVQGKITYHLCSGGGERETTHSDDGLATTWQEGLRFRVAAWKQRHHLPRFSCWNWQCRVKIPEAPLTDVPKP